MLLFVWPSVLSSLSLFVWSDLCQMAEIVHISYY